MMFSFVRLNFIVILSFFAGHNRGFSPFVAVIDKMFFFFSRLIVHVKNSFALQLNISMIKFEKCSVLLLFCYFFSHSQTNKVNKYSRQLKYYPF